MDMTHYMSLLAENQPWNLILFMAVPVIFAETITITEFFILFNKNENGKLRLFNRFCSIAAGLYFTGIFIYLMINAVIPLTLDGSWNTWVDVVAVGFYLSGILFLLPLALLEMGWIYKNRRAEEKMRLHFILVGGFLVVAHIAMIFGMVNPDIVSSGSSSMTHSM